MRILSFHDRAVRAVIVLVLVAAASVLLSGCASTGTTTDATDPLPWNQPAGWENTTIGIPF